MAIIICTNCGGGVSEFAKHCPHCGTHEFTIQPKELIRCQECDALIPDKGINVCPACGLPILRFDGIYIYRDDYAIRFMDDGEVRRTTANGFRKSDRFVREFLGFRSHESHSGTSIGGWSLEGAKISFNIPNDFSSTLEEQKILREIYVGEVGEDNLQLVMHLEDLRDPNQPTDYIKYNFAFIPIDFSVETR